MPIYHPDHIEYAINTGRIQIAMEDGSRLPAYWAHPSIGDVFPGVVLIHDWWGITDVERTLANLFGQMGYYVIVPDLFHGKIASNPREAMELVKQLDDGHGYNYVDTSLQVLETHHRSNRSVAAIGMGMGGSLAFEAAINRPDLEAAVSFCGFPQRYLGKFDNAPTPILAFYGSREPHVPKKVINRLRREFKAAKLNHEIVMIEGATRDFFTNNRHDFSKAVLIKTLAFLEKHLEQSKRRPASRVM
jgi:carboxymethylenebutenolidase